MCLALVSSPALQRAAGVKERREEKRKEGRRSEIGPGEWPDNLALWFSSPTLTQKLLHFLNAFCG